MMSVKKTKTPDHYPCGHMRGPGWHDWRACLTKRKQPAETSKPNSPDATRHVPTLQTLGDAPSRPSTKGSMEASR